MVIHYEFEFIICQSKEYMQILESLFFENPVKKHMIF